MPNKNYIAGRRKEYKIVNRLKSESYIAQRTAGSHSPFDVVAIHPERKIVMLIQSKPKNMSEKEREKVKVDAYNKLGLTESGNGLYMVHFVLE